MTHGEVRLLLLLDTLHLAAGRHQHSWHRFCSFLTNTSAEPLLTDLFQVALKAAHTDRGKKKSHSAQLVHLKC